MQVSITCDHTVDDVVFLLKRNWFFDVDDLYKLCWELPDHIWEAVVARMSEYPVEVQNLLRDPVKIYPRNMKIRSMTEDEYTNIRREQDDNFERRKREHKDRFVPEPRPKETIDYELDKITNELNEKQDILKDVSKSWKRKMHEPLIRDTEQQIAKLQNELDFYTKRVDAANKIWLELQWLDALLQDATKGSI